MSITDKYVLEFDGKQFETGMGKVKSGSDEAFGSAKKSEQSFTESLVKSQIILKAYGMALGVVTDFVKDGFKSAAEYERTTISLTAALEGQGRSVQASLPLLQGQLDALEGLAGISDEVTRKMAAQAVNMGVATDKIKPLIEASIRLSNVTGRDVNSAMEALIKSTNGSGEAIKKMAPIFHDLTDEQLAAGDAIKEINTQWEGQIDLLNRGFTGQIHQLGTAFGNLGENLATAATNSTIAKGAMSGLIDVVNDFVTLSSENPVLAALGFPSALLIPELADAAHKRAEALRFAHSLQPVQEPGEETIVPPALETIKGLKPKPTKKDPFASANASLGRGDFVGPEIPDNMKAGWDAAEANNKYLIELEERYNKGMAGLADDRRHYHIELSNKMLAEEEAVGQERMAIAMKIGEGVGGIMEDAANTALRAAISSVNGQAVAFDQVAKKFLEATGMKLVGAGIADNMEGAARAIRSYGADASAYALGVQGAAEIGVGAAMIAGSLAIKPSGGGSSGGGGSFGGGGSIGAGRVGGGGIGSPQQTGQALPPVTINVIGDLSDRDAKIIRDGLNRSARRGVV